jgi:DNA-binding MarR family transcriptional regulator
VRDDPERRNAKIVVYTEKGRQVNRAGARIIEQIEQRLAERLGADRLETLRELLAEDWD